MAKRRDKYGRYRGKGGIKPYRSNLTGVKKTTAGKKMSGRKKAVIGVAATATVLGIAYANRRGIAQITGADTKIAGAAMANARAARGPRATPLIELKPKKALKANPFNGIIAATSKQQPSRKNQNFTPGRAPYRNTISQQLQQNQRPTQIVNGLVLKRPKGVR